MPRAPLRQSRLAALSLLPAGLAALAAALVWWLAAGSPAAFDWRLGVLLAIALVAALHRPFRGQGLALGSVVLPLTLTAFGPLWAAALAAVAIVLVAAIRRLLPVIEHDPESRLDAWAPLAAAGRGALAVLAAGVVWRSLVGPAAMAAKIGRVASPAATALLWSGATYLAMGLLLGTLQLWLLGRRPRPAVAAWLLQAAGWGVGGLYVFAVAGLGWRLGLALLSVPALILAEATRLEILRGRLRRHLDEEESLKEASQRMVAPSGELDHLAARIRSECRKVLPFDWFELTLRDEEGKTRSWSAGPDGRLGDGPAAPPERPRARGGFHRRADWERIARKLAGEGSERGRLELWCHPSRVEERQLELLDDLVPQLAASLDRALLDREARLDPLTGLAQRRVLERQLEEGFEHAAEGGGTLAVVMCDLDHFKRINDGFGHTVGDEALVAIARLLEAHRRGSDLCCRYGGEEFTLLLFDSDGARALAVAERLRRAVESHEFIASGKRVPLTLSIGLAVFPELIARDGEDLLATADLALYEAKRQGRNRCLLAIGKGRFKTPAGDVISGDDASPSTAPQIFA